MQPLTGIRVIDFTQAVAGPTCTMWLGDFGAEVIKVEPPPDGEGGRRWGSARFGENDQFSSLFLAFNRNKSSVLLDLKSAEGKAVVERLIASSDVVVENFKPGTADSLGIGYARASELKRDIVYCSISGYGQTGPLRERPGLDLSMQAYAGHLSITGEEDRPAVRIGPSSIDIMTGAHAAIGIFAALRVRDITGEGQYVDTSLYDSALHMIAQYVADYTGTGKVPEKSGPYFAFLAPYGMFRAMDRDIYIGPNRDHSVAALMKKLGLSDLLSDPRFRTNRDRVMNRAALHEHVLPAIKKFTAGELMAFCTENDVPASLIEDVSEVVVQEQALAREMILDTGIGGVRMTGIPVKLSRTPGTVRRQAPALGDANALVGAEKAPA